MQVFWSDSSAVVRELCDCQNVSVLVCFRDTLSSICMWDGDTLIGLDRVLLAKCQLSCCGINQFVRQGCALVFN